MAEIPVFLRSRGRPKWVSGVAAATSCRDVVASVLASAAREEGVAAVEPSDFVLVEQWRGVERPLAGASKILRLWEAWGDEQAHVRFVVKRVRQRTGKSPSSGRSKSRDDGDEAATNRLLSPAEFDPDSSNPRADRNASTSSVAAPQHHRLSRRLRRRNSVSSNASDTPHPRKFLQRRQQQQQDLNKSQDIEDMMKEIMRQGQMICRELTRIDPRFASSSTLAVFGPESSPSRSNGNDVTVSSSGADAEDEEGNGSVSDRRRSGVAKTKSRKSAASSPAAGTAALASSSFTKSDYYYDRRKSGGGGGGGRISGAHLSNDDNDTVAILQEAQLAATPEEQALMQQELEKTRALVTELSRLTAVNEELQSVETKCHLLGANLQQLRLASPPPPEPTAEEAEQLRRARGAVAVLRATNDRAESDIRANSGALDGLSQRCAERRDALKRLEYDVNVVEKECRKLGKEYQKVLSLAVPELPPGEEDLQPVIDKSQVIYTELKELQLENAQRLMALEGAKEDSIEAKEAKRVLANGSPEGSSSGASSGADDSTASGSTLCVSDSPGSAANGGGKDGSAKTVRFRDVADDSVICEKSRVSCRDVDDDGDNNSDTGLSSLHSGSGDDEAAAATNTARAMAAAVKNEEPGAFTLDFGTLV